MSVPISEFMLSPSEEFVQQSEVVTRRVRSAQHRLIVPVSDLDRAGSSSTWQRILSKWSVN